MASDWSGVRIYPRVLRPIGPLWVLLLTCSKMIPAGRSSLTTNIWLPSPSARFTKKVLTGATNNWGSARPLSPC
eukprot:165623-Prorocentrum_minimum.AAC.2